jgi:FHS family glucose/mannose:H+ symporter-like MFS transporter
MKRFLFAAHAVFALIGIANTMLGPLLPLLAQRWHLADRQAGMLFIALFVGGFAGAITSTQLPRLFALHNVARTGLLLVALGVLGVAAPSRVLATVGIALNGFGLGFITPSITALASELFPERRASTLNLLNFSWALGAITAPNLILAAFQHFRFQVPGMLIIYAVVLALSAFLVPSVEVAAGTAKNAYSKLPKETFRLILACGALIFLYVGVEAGFAGWLPSYVTRMHGFTLRRAALLQDTFWITFLAGRFCAPAFLRVIEERVVLTSSICLSAIGTASLLVAHVPAVLFLSVGLTGAGCAAIFPTAIARLSHRLVGRSGSTLGFMFASAGLGGAVLPFCVGSLSSATQNLRIGMSLLFLAEIGLFGAHLVMSKLVARAPNRPDIDRGVIATPV